MDKRIIVETDDLSNASPALINRLQVVHYASPDTTLDVSSRVALLVDDVMADIKKKIADNKEKLERAKIVASPPGVPPPPVVPILEPGKIGFVENAERQNSRWSMVGWWSLLLVELVAGKGLLELMGFTVGKGINFTF